MSEKDDHSEEFNDILNLVQSHLIDSTFIPQNALTFVAQNFTNPKVYTTFHHPLLTALPPKTPILPNPTTLPFLILHSNEKISTKLFAGTFAWIDENILHEDIELGGLVKEKWMSLVAAIVHPDSTIVYYKVHNGIHKPLEGMAGV
jgi:hypothetical protein